VGAKYRKVADERASVSTSQTEVSADRGRTWRPATQDEVDRAKLMGSESGLMLRTRRETHKERPQVDVAIEDSGDADPGVKHGVRFYDEEQP